MIGLQSTSISPLPIAYIITLIIIPAKGFGRIPGRKASPTRPMAEQASEVTIHILYPILSTNLGKEKTGGNKCNISKCNIVFRMKLQI